MPLRKNLIANYLGQGWTALMQLAFIPIYIKYLGMESYGLIGIFAILQAGLLLLDAGMTPTINREMARYSAGAHTPRSIRELLHSLEWLCFVLALAISGCAWLASSWFAQNWLRSNELPPDVVAKAVSIMGIVAAFRFVESIYRGALLGLQTQVWLNAVTAAMATARGLGAVGILVWISPTIEAFFVWQAWISLVSMIILARRVHRALPTVEEPIRFSTRAISGVWNFARGMIATTFLSLLLTQVDKILLSRILNLEEFGAYMLAATTASALSLVITPLAQGYYPRFIELLTRNDEPALILAYHQASQLMAVVLVPASMMLIFHGETALYLWTGNAELAHNSSALISLLTLGTTFLGLMNIPYMLQLAYGWSTFAAKVNAILVIVLVPVLFWATPRYGALGAAWVWVAVTSSYIFLVIPIMHQRLLPKEIWVWYWQDNGLPAASAACVAYAAVWIKPVGVSKFELLLWFMSMALISLIAALLFTPTFRGIFSRKVSTMINGRN